MAELSRRGFFKGLLGLAVVAVLGKSTPPSGASTVAASPPKVVSGLAIQQRCLGEHWWKRVNEGPITLDHVQIAKQVLALRREMEG